VGTVSRMKLVDNKTLASGIVILSYQPTPTATTPGTADGGTFMTSRTSRGAGSELESVSLSRPNNLETHPSTVQGLLSSWVGPPWWSGRLLGRGATWIIQSGKQPRPLRGSHQSNADVRLPGVRFAGLLTEGTAQGDRGAWRPTGRIDPSFEGTPSRAERSAPRQPTVLPSATGPHRRRRSSHRASRDARTPSSARGPSAWVPGRLHGFSLRFRLHPPEDLIGGVSPPRPGGSQEVPS
jgi:hypothetical protein